MKTLLIEQDQNFADRVQKALVSRDGVVDVAMDWGTGWQLAELFQYDVILLDLVCPDVNGIKFCQRRRATGDQTPILIMGIEYTSSYEGAALKAGANEYLIKPVIIEALLTKIQALVQNQTHSEPSMIEWQGLHLNFQDCHASYNDSLLHLNPLELTLLALFVQNCHRIFSPTGILEHIWRFYCSYFRPSRTESDAA